MILTNQEKNTLVAALAFYLEKGQGEPNQRTNEIHNLSVGNAPELEEDVSMDDEGIESLMVKVVDWA